jgi:NAD dependent epimerase/dehydratase family enzyme
VVQVVELARVKPGVVIQASGVCYYGPRGDEEIVEEESPGNDFLGELAIE